MRPHSIIRTLAAAALIALPSIAMAAPDQNTNPGRYPNNNGCPQGQWNNNGTCVNNGQNGQNGQWNNGQNGQWNNGRHRHRDRDDRDNRGDRDDRNNNGNNGRWNNNGNNGNYNGGYNNGGYGNRSGQLSGSVRSFSPYNLYLSNGTHVILHNGTVINPTGTNLAAGERVRVIGNWNQDGTFNANEVDVTGNGGYNRYQR